MWQLSFPYTEEAARSLCKDPTALKSEILRRCAKWHEPIPELLRSTPLDGMAGYPVYDREVLQPDVLRPGSSAAATGAAAASTPAAQRRVTLIGDAAHPMTPFKAQGANQALSDAVLLADTLVESIQRHGPHAGLDAALPLFEQTMLSRSVRVATEHGQMPAHLSHGQTPAHLGSARARPRLLPSARLMALGGSPLSGQRGRYRPPGDEPLPLVPRARRLPSRRFRSLCPCRWLARARRPRRCTAAWPCSRHARCSVRRTLALTLALALTSTLTPTLTPALTLNLTRYSGGARLGLTCST